VSVSFKVRAEQFDRNPGLLTFNPAGLPQRSVTDAKLHEFSVVTFAAYKDTSVSVSGRAPRWYIGQRIPSGPYLPVPATVRRGSEPWRLGPKPWELSKPRKPRWKLSERSDCRGADGLMGRLRLPGFTVRR
jgi:hypothetical protein